jgi:hypothetical protein
MEILCYRCDDAAAGLYDTELLCSGCAAAEIEYDRAAVRPSVPARITRIALESILSGSCAPFSIRAS